MQNLAGNLIFENMDLYMDLIKKFFLFFKRLSFSTNDISNISKFVFYKIIDMNQNKNDVYIIQCVNSKSIFESHLSEIVFDTDILYGLHPLQACFIGIEYAKFIKSNMLDPKSQIKKINVMNKQVIHNYGILKLKYQDRKGDICFINSCTNEEDIMSPKDIAFTDNIIKKFHAEQAFFIGICAGQKIHKDPENVIYLKDCNVSFRKKPHKV